MCKYCEGEETQPIMSYKIDKSHTCRLETYIYLGRDPLLVTETAIDGVNVTDVAIIRYCPMCKRDLRRGVK